MTDFSVCFFSGDFRTPHQCSRFVYLAVLEYDPILALRVRGGHLSICEIGPNAFKVTMLRSAVAATPGLVVPDQRPFVDVQRCLAWQGAKFSAKLRDVVARGASWQSPEQTVWRMVSPIGPQLQHRFLCQQVVRAREPEFLRETALRHQSRRAVHKTQL